MNRSKLTFPYPENIFLRNTAGQNLPYKWDAQTYFTCILHVDLIIIVLYNLPSADQAVIWDPFSQEKNTHVYFLVILGMIRTINIVHENGE